MDAKKLKLIVKGEKKPTFGTDPNEPWSARAGITESERGELHAYLKSRGINPDFVSKDTKISHAKSSEFHKWRRDHQFDDPINFVSTTAADRMKQQRAQTEEVESIDEKNVPTSPEKWARAKAQAKSKFAVYPSAYANGWASKKYKAMGGGWKSVSEESEQPDELTSEAWDNSATKIKKSLSAGTYNAKPTALERFRAAAAERAKKHDDAEKEMKARHAAGKEDMKGSIDRLEKQLNKEESVVNEMDTYPHTDSKEGKALMKAFKSSAKKDPTDLNAPGKSPTVKQTTSALLPMLNKSFKKSMKKEETINEVSSSEVEHHFHNWTNSEHAPYNSDAGDDNKVHQSALRYLNSTNVPKENHEKLAMHIAHKFHGSSIDEASGISKTKETSFHKKLDTLVHKTFGKRKDELKMKEEVVTEKNDSHTHAAHYEDPKTGEWTGMNLLIAKDDDDAIRQANEKCKEGCRLTKVERHITVKEEVEQIDELKKSTVFSWLKQQPVVPVRKPGTDRVSYNQKVKNHSKSWNRALDRLAGYKPTSEDVFQDTQAATQTPFDMGTQADDREPVYSKKKEMSKSARMIKSLYKKHRMVKEDLYDHEKEDKSVASYGKKPKVEKQEVYGDENSQAAMILKGGTTLTGQPRDTLEIDPVMRKPVKPDNQISNKKTDK
jgi:hypothetical protein